MTVFQPPRSHEIQSTRLVASQDEFRHVLLAERGVIETHVTTTTFATRRGGNNSSSKKKLAAGFDGGWGRVFRTELPDHIKAALAIDDPVELIGLGVRNNQADASRGSRAGPLSPDRGRTLPPAGATRCKLCLYTRKDAFVMDIEFGGSSSSNDDNESSSHSDEGIILRTTEPLEQVTGASGYEILRIRAPSKSSQALVASSGCFAALIKEGNECCRIYMYHHKSQADQGVAVTNQFALRNEDVPEEQIVDFCFAESAGLSLFASLSILLLKASGDILAASPFVFEGSIVSKARLNQSLAFLRENGGRSAPKIRQCKAAERFLTDTFCFEDVEGRFATARVIDQRREHPSQWPVTHGTVYYQGSVEQNSSQSIETIGRFDQLVGITVGKEDCQVDLIAISPSSLLPRFELESREDCYIIDDEIMKASRCVEKICLGVETKESWTVVKDRIVDELIHCVTDHGVYTISSNALQECDKILKGQARNVAAASAWITLSASSRIVGVGLSDDLAAGHEMIVYLENGTATMVNVSDAKSRHDFKKFFESQGDHGSGAAPLLTNEPSDPALVDVIQPLLKKINDGLASMAMISGSETLYTEIGPEELAAVVAIKQQCDDGLVIPIEELKRVVSSCQVNLRKRLSEQASQLRSVEKQAEELRSKIADNTSALESAKVLAKSQLERAKALLDISKQLVPRITEAEITFFRDIQRLERKCTVLEAQAQRNVARTAALASPHEAPREKGSVKVVMDDKTKTNLGMLADTIEKQLTVAKGRWKKVEYKFYQMQP